MAVTEKDRDILARTLWGEARGEGPAGQIAVAWTIRNRVFDGKEKSWWGEGYAGVCQKPWQFSCWNRNSSDYCRATFANDRSDLTRRTTQRTRHRAGIFLPGEK